MHICTCILVYKFYKYGLKVTIRRREMEVKKEKGGVGQVGALLFIHSASEPILWFQSSQLRFFETLKKLKLKSQDTKKHSF